MSAATNPNCGVIYRPRYYNRSGRTLTREGGGGSNSSCTINPLFCNAGQPSQAPRVPFPLYSTLDMRRVACILFHVPHLFSTLATTETLLCYFRCPASCVLRPDSCSSMLFFTWCTSRLPQHSVTPRIFLFESVLNLPCLLVSPPQTSRALSQTTFRPQIWLQPRKGEAVSHDRYHTQMRAPLSVMIASALKRPAAPHPIPSRTAVSASLVPMSIDALARAV